jgi:hypothetical protein
MATWYPRTTDGYPSWFTLEGGAAEVASDFVAHWERAGPVGQNLVATYNVGVTSTEVGWFERLTGGYNTWGGQSQASGTSGSINGSDVLPITVEQAFLAVYSVNLTAQSDLLAVWSSRAAVTQDFVASWSSQAYVTSDLVASWSVAEGYLQVVVDLAASYQLLSTVERDGPAFWNVLNAVEQDYAATYHLNDTVFQDFTCEWDVITVPLSAGNDFTASWSSVQTVSADYAGAFHVTNAMASASELTAEWGIRTTVEADFEVLWQRHAQVQNFLAAVWQITGVYEKRKMRATIDGYAMSTELIDPVEETTVHGNELRVT